MDHLLDSTRQPERRKDIASRQSLVAPPLHPLLQLQQQAGNQAVQELLHSGLIRAKLAVSQPDDPEEREADQVADRVMRSHAGLPTSTPCTCASGGEMCEECQRKQAATVARKPATSANTATPHNGIENVLRSSGHPLDAAARAFFEPHFGKGLGDVRIHADAHAAAASRSINALAFTLGRDVTFAEGQYQPGTMTGRKLLAHELTHVVQQTSGKAGPASTNGVVQRAPTISIIPENTQAALAPTERRAAKSCPITCCDKTLGTLHAMPLFFHQSRGAIVAAGSAKATGIGAELHFIAAGTQPPAGDLCHCDDFRMIQVLTSNVPDDPRGKNNFVDNNAGATPFYGDVYLSGRGEHAIPPGYVDAGEKVKTTESIYDRPYRPLAELGTTNLSWMAETCVSCIKNPKPDRVLGCVTYGFTQNYNAASTSFDPVVAVGPACLPKPSANFVTTLSTDTSTSTYNFKSSPEAIECNPPKKNP